MGSLTDQVSSLLEQFLAEARIIQERPSFSSVESLRIAWTGRKGSLGALYEGLRSAPREEKPVAGKAVNRLRKLIEEELDRLRELSADWEIGRKLSAPPLDISLPVRAQQHSGSRHPVTLMREIMLKVFRRMGFTVRDGPEIESDFYNFSALNISEHHPARDMQDTFFLKGQNQLLRTHTSNIQIHTMLKERPPLRMVAPGRVYRVDNDATHTPMFHQLECVLVDRGISFAHLKGTIDAFLREVFGSKLKTRFRPSYFPFVEPGAEVDLQCTICKGHGCRVCSHSGWLEIGGAGMIHPNVFEAVQYDSEEYTGFAFGFGIDRMAMLAWSLPDLRQLFSGDSGFLSQFPTYASDEAAAPSTPAP